MPTPEPQQTTADVADAQAELEKSLQELADRLNPRNLATEAADAAKQAVADAGNVVTGKGLPHESPSRARNAKVLLAAAAATAVAIAWSALRHR